MVSEPPVPVERWPADGLALVGLERAASSNSHLAVFELSHACPERFPRRSLRPPLFAPG